METVLFVAVALLGSFVQTSCGLGFAVICVSFWSQIGRASCRERV